MAYVGDTLELKTAGTYSGAVSTLTYQWQRSDDGSSGWTDIPGETGLTYTLASGDAGKFVALLETATGPGGSTNARSAAEAVTGLTVPAQFGPSDWSVADKGTGGTITITITTLPSNGGSPITALQYQINGGAWASFSGTTTGSYDVSGLTNGVAVTVAIRAVNAIGNGAASATKSATPTVPLAKEIIFNGAGSGGGGSPITFSIAASTGSPGSKELVVAAFAVSRNSGTNFTISGVTIGGVAATEINGTTTTNAYAKLYYAEVPVGTSRNVVISSISSTLYVEAVVYALTNYQSAVPTDSQIITTSSGSINLGVNAGGVAIVAAVNRNGTGIGLAGISTDRSNGVATHVWGAIGSYGPGAAATLTVSRTGTPETGSRMNGASWR